MAIQPNATRLSEKDIMYLLFSILCFCGFYGAWPLGVYVDTGLFYISIPTYILYIIVSCVYSDAATYMRNKKPLSNTYKDVERA